MRDPITKRSSTSNPCPLTARTETTYFPFDKLLFYGKLDLSSLSEIFAVLNGSEGKTLAIQTFVEFSTTYPLPQI